MSRALDVVTLTGAEYDALTQRADDWYALYARAAKERTAALEDVERWKKGGMAIKITDFLYKRILE